MLEKTRDSLARQITETETVALDRINRLDNKTAENLTLEKERLAERVSRAEDKEAEDIFGMRQRTERFVQEFDEALAGVHRAILGLSKDKSMIGSNIVVPIPDWDRQVERGSGREYADKVQRQDELLPAHNKGAAAALKGSPEGIGGGGMKCRRLSGFWILFMSSMCSCSIRLSVNITSWLCPRRPGVGMERFLRPSTTPKLCMICPSTQDR